MEDWERARENERRRGRGGRERYRPYTDYDQENDYGREDFERFGGRGSYDQESGYPGSFAGMERREGISRREGGYYGGRERREQEQLGRGGGSFDRGPYRGGEREGGRTRGLDYERGGWRGFGREGRYEEDYDRGRQDFGFDTEDWERSYEMRGGTGASMAYGSYEGPFSGRGPKGYQRSDDRIREDVCERLAGHGWVDASEIEVEVNDGEVTLKGTVYERGQKRMAEYAVDDVPGVREVHNEVRISREGAMSGEHRDPFKPDSGD